MSAVIQVVRETHEAAESVQRRLRLAGGMNRFGEANYRAVWGWNRLTLIGGTWEKDNEDGKPAELEYRWVPKYPAVNRWHIEKWVAAETYGSPLLWWGTEKERELGPYPVRGDYEHCFTVEDARGGFVQLTATVAERIALAIQLAERFPRSAKKAALYRREEKADDDYLKWAYDVLDDAVPAFHKQPFVTVA